MKGIKGISHVAVALAGLLATVSGMAAFTCKDLVGTWSGPTAHYSSVELQVLQFDDSSYYMNIYFKQGGIKDGAEGINGTCQVQPNGEVKAEFIQSIAGIGDVDITAQLNSASQVHIDGHVPIYQDSFVGDINKQS